MSGVPDKPGFSCGPDRVDGETWGLYGAGEELDSSVGREEKRDFSSGVSMATKEQLGASS